MWRARLWVRSLFADRSRYRRTTHLLIDAGCLIDLLASRLASLSEASNFAARPGTEDSHP